MIYLHVYIKTVPNKITKKIGKLRQWSANDMCVHEQAHVTSTDISTSCILNGCVCHQGTVFLLKCKIPIKFYIL